MCQWRSLSAYQRLGLVTIFGLIVLVVLGGTVRVTDSGLACPDWPLCHGKVIPAGGYHVWLEWTHRLAASVFGFVILAFVIGALRRHRDRRWVVVPALLGAVALAVQVVLGGLTVTEDLDAAIVAAHLGTAMLIVLLIVVAWLATFVPRAEGSPEQREQVAARAGPADPSDRRMALLACLTAAGTYVLIVLGGYVSGTEAGYFCGGDWPLCNGVVLPEGRNALIHVSHRFLAAAVALLVLATVWMAERRSRSAPTVFRLALAVGGLYAAQIILGAVVMWTTLAEWSRVLHLVTGSVTWGTLVAMTAFACYDAIRSDSLHRPRPFPSVRPRRAGLGETRR
ncbi:MAG: COX15/CtaA family protein [Chloroflexi bacterium]|nr:COX15/CtaA family protein [Chloroflexota bacterium]